MCCFSGKVNMVADTNIFARPAKDGRQYLVYSMRVGAPDDLAMILPIPTPKDSKEDAVRFINLEKYANFFAEMSAGFPVPRSKSDSRTLGAPAAGGLKVVEVGSFVASFVPSLDDFARLDAQFRLPPATWEKLPQHKHWGFAVFKLKKGEKKVHPMAFEFPRVNRTRLFFPTVHIHDGTVPERAKFDHMLYAQFTDGTTAEGWEESPQPAELFMTHWKDSAGIVDEKDHVHRRAIRGMQKNADVVV